MPSDYIAAARLRTALRELVHSTELVTRRHRLTPRRYELLLFVQAADDEGAPATVTSLCGSLRTTQSSVTQLVGASVRAGLQRRAPAPHDRRSMLLRLTPLGRRRLAAVFAELGPEREALARVIDEHFDA